MDLFNHYSYFRVLGFEGHTVGVRKKEPGLEFSYSFCLVLCNFLIEFSDGGALVLITTMVLIYFNTIKNQIFVGNILTLPIIASNI